MLPRGSTQSFAYGINNSGQIVGQYNPGNNQYSAFLYSSGTFTTLSVPGANGCCTNALGINDAGQVVGNYSMNGSSHGFLYSNGTYTTLTNPLAPNDTSFSGINNSGQIVGQYAGAGAANGFLLSNGTYTILTHPDSVPASAPVTEALGINNLGQIVGMFRNPAGTADRGFLYSSGQYSTLSDPLNPNNTWADGINDLGQIVGSIDQLGFLYSNGTYTTTEGPAYGINDEGQVVGYLINGAVPEPSTWTMLLIGLAGIGLMTYRRRKSAMLAA